MSEQIGIQPRTQNGVQPRAQDGMRTSAHEAIQTSVQDGAPSTNGKAVPEQVETLIIGGGQSGLSVGYQLSRRDRPFVIVDANERIGDSWRNRWDSLRLFTPAKFNGLAGMAFPAHKNDFPPKDEMADYLEAYAERFELPVRTGVKIDGLAREGDRFIAEAGDRRFEADNVVVAMSNYQKPRVPAFAGELDDSLVQLHSVDYRNPSQLNEGGVLIVGAGNSGSEIARELSQHGHPVWMSGRNTGAIPFRIEGFAGRHLLVRLVLRVLFHRILTVDTPIGRKARPKIISQGGPLVRVKPWDLDRMGVERVPRVTGVRRGRALLADERVLDVANVVWCTGFHPGFSWIDIPDLMDDRGEPAHECGMVPDVPGLYFVGLNFLYALTSAMIHGVARDADRIAEAIASRVHVRSAA